ncbi:hypothetical protein I4U23_030489 [Adineta vaga]|nr:hypothetical protein I4U23_030489 [Adineta vaga]
MQHPPTCNTPPVSTSPSSPSNLPSINVTLPPTKLTTSVTAPGSTATITNNPSQQLRTTTTFLPNQPQSTSQTQTLPSQIRQIFTNANNTSLQTQSTTNTQRLTEAAQRSPTSIQQILASRAASLPGQVRNVRILTFTPGTNSTTGIGDTTTTTTTANSSQTPLQTTNITYNRTNSNSTSFQRSTTNLDQDISPDLAAQIQRLKSFNVTNTDPNDPNQTPRAVLVPARTISGSSTPSSATIGATAKIKSTSLIDPTTLGLTGKTSQANFVLQLPSITTTSSGDDQTAMNASGLIRQNLMQQLNLRPSSINQRAQSPTTISNATNSMTVNRFVPQFHIRTTATLNSSPSTTTHISTGQPINEQIASASPPPPPPTSSSSSSSSTT